MARPSNPFDQFRFRDLHPLAALGTASDRYAGWIGQIYTPGRYDEKIKKRQKTVVTRNFQEDVLPVESAAEYFEHFRVLELDYTFYSPLLDEGGKPAPNYMVLESYCRYLKDDDRLILKVPQLIFAQKIRQGGSFQKNEYYLNPEVFVERFYKPAVELIGTRLEAFVFEQEYQRKNERITASGLAAQLEEFFSRIPEDERYHIELRTESYLAEPVFKVFERYGIGQVLSHWTWLPPLSAQLAMSRWRFFNKGKRSVIRLMTPRGVRYEEAYAKASPFSALIDGMIDPKMIEDTVRIMQEAVKKGVFVNVIVNNRAGGNAPMTAQLVAQRFLSSS
jgi:uncharacterized protein YecE (DUF72 family)